jgi:hypothetical protein
MTYVGKKPADIIATAVDTTTGTFSGDLTVDTNTLFVDSDNNRVGVGTVSPAKPLHIFNSGTSYVQISGNSRDLFLGQDATGGAVFSTGAVPLYFSTDSTERMRIDSIGNVGIGTSATPAGSGSSSRFITIAGTNDGVIQLTKTNATAGGAAIASAAGTGMLFYTHTGTVGSENYSERMRIDSSGNLLVGTTDSNLTDNTTGKGIVAQANGALVVAREANTPFYVNRTGTSDGTLVDFRKDGGTVGSIGVADSGDRIYLAGGGLEGVGIDNGANAFVPTSETGAYKDNHMTLGRSDARFTELHLSSRLHTPSITGPNTASSLSIATGHASSPFIFYTGQFGVSAEERMRIDTSGNLLVGTTSVNPADNNDASGSQLSSAGTIQTSASNVTPAIFNRGNDGATIGLLRAGVSVGSIGTQSSGRTYIANASMGITFNQTNYIMPSNGSGAENDNSVDLGKNNSRFKDLYLSGGAYIGGTGSANYLDSYEEGNFTPTLGSSSNRVGTWTSATGKYTKVGNEVTLHISITGSGMRFSATSGYQAITGLPFSALQPSGSQNYAGAWSGGAVAYSSGGSVYLYASTMYLHNSNPNQDSAGVASIGVGITYFTS